jgi:hypothetical protein
MRPNCVGVSRSVKRGLATKLTNDILVDPVKIYACRSQCWIVNSLDISEYVMKVIDYRVRRGGLNDHAIWVALNNHPCIWTIPSSGET